MNAIGGYFGLELFNGEEYHANAMKLNTGRNALAYILKAYNFKKIHLPFFTCDVLLEPIQKLNIKVEFYNINEFLEPVFNFETIKEDEAFLYTSYFGLKDDFAQSLAKKCKNLIVDNAQSFYSKPIKGVPTFYSPRKFFGVPDGAYLYCNKTINTELEKDISYKRFEHLLRRIDVSAENGYSYFKANDNSLSNQPIKEMSKLTQSILSAIDYKNCAKIRKENFNVLNNKLGASNKFSFSNIVDAVPMIYPYWSTDNELREKLINNRIYTASYWSNVLDWCSENDIEYKMVKEIVYLPIDQRYSFEDIDKILKLC